MSQARACTAADCTGVHITYSAPPVPIQHPAPAVPDTLERLKAELRKFQEREVLLMEAYEELERNVAKEVDAALAEERRRTGEDQLRAKVARRVGGVAGNEGGLPVQAVAASGGCELGRGSVG